MEGLSFQPGDAEALKELCDRARRRARNDPCNTAPQAGDPKYSFRFAGWNLSFTLDRWLSKPQWHASAAILDMVGHQPQQLASGIIVEVPTEAILATESWSEEHKKQCKFLLGELMGPMILKEDTKVIVHTGLMAEHWLTDYVSVG